MRQLLKFGLPLLLIGGVVAYQMLQPKGTPDIHQLTTEVTTTATGLYDAFDTDEGEANTAYVGKVIEVSGELTGIEVDSGGGYLLSLQSGSPLGKVVCNLAAGEPNPTDQLAIGSVATVKGTCTGYLFDVVIDNATLQTK